MLKPVPPLKQSSITNQYRADLTLSPEVYNHLRGLQKKAKDLRTEVKTIRRLAQSQAVAVREDIKDTFMRIRATLLASSGNQWIQGDQERVRYVKSQAGKILTTKIIDRLEFLVRKKFTNKKLYAWKKIWQI